jgi:hypothetical protein
MDRLTTAVVTAITTAPCSLRALARESHVSHVLLVQITKGRQKATPAVAAKVAAALERWATRCGKVAKGIRQTLQRRGDK